jgi:MFS family permease
VSTDTSNSPGARLSVFAPQFRPITLSTLTLIALAAFDGMAVSAALPKIGADLGVGRLPWVLTSFQLTSTISMLAAGPVIDAIGVRRAYRFTLIVFFVTSLLCTLAPNLQALIAARALQGVGGGIVMAVTIANVGLSYPAELRSRALAANSSVWGTMALAGPAVVAFLLSYVSWRGVFFINLPLVAFAAVIGWNRLPDTDQRHAIDFDSRGLMMVGAVVVALLVGLGELNRWSLVALVVAIAFAVVYWRHSGSTAAPVLARRHFAAWPFGALNAIPFAFFAGSLAVDSYLPIYVQGALGRSSAVAAFTVAFLAIGWTIGSQIVSRLLDRVRNVDVILAGFVITMPALLAGVLVYTDHAPLGLVLVFSFLQGLGIGSVTNATLSLLQRTVPAAEMGRASAAHQFMRQLGGTLGTAAAGAVLFGVVSSRIGSVEPVRELLGGKKIELASETRSAIAAGFRGAAGVALVLTAISFAFAFAVRRRFLRSDASLN